MDKPPNKGITHYTAVKVLFLSFLVLVVSNLVFASKDEKVDRPISSKTSYGYFIPIESLHELDALMEEIIKRESNGNHMAKNPTSTAFGYCQFITSTWNYVQDKWDVELERTNEWDQLYACQRLLYEEGITHWKASGPYE